ncbi:S53 family peptidase [Mycobacterium intracellulare]|uniref:S53 family peptidase n=1 Tax=Mycobacterium intracellulare TaxID=1767 RepID=UPI00109E9C39|nr:S53 family peptidase [Mycobacterium intracellulare]
MAQLRTAIRRPHSSQPASLTPRQVAAAYHFPIDKASGKGYVGGIIELGGGFKAPQVAAYFTAHGLPTPKFTAVPVAGGKNKPDGPDGADGEVQLDMIVAGAIAPGAAYRVYFAPNDDAGFLAAIKRALADGCNGISISWGGSENNWDGSTMDEFEAVIKAARAAGVPVFVAAGDTGSQDSSGAGNQTDFPASSPSAIGCGGTRLILSGTERASETVWNDSPTQSATGGGVSKYFAGRQVPDIAGNADPDTGYEVSIDGESAVIGGTSAVAPLMLGLHALLWERNGGKAFDMMNLIATNPEACFDVTAGNNGGYRAGPGRDNTTGLGVPDGQKLLDALLGPVPAPAPPDPTPTSSDPLASFPTASALVWLHHKHNHTKIEAQFAADFVAWAAAVGLDLDAIS